MNQTVDAETTKRLRDEFGKVAAAVRGKGQATVEDPLGEDGLVTILVEGFRATGAGEVQLLKDDGQGNKRWTKYRTWGPNGTDFVEKTSYLKRADGATEFHKKRAQPGDEVQVSDQAEEADDQNWIQNLA
ncbi:MAG TPA: hypothetical protein VGO93_16965 [Candidatus Xenobia bacterium]|jgi:hypothetical protein